MIRKTFLLLAVMMLSLFAEAALPDVKFRRLDTRNGLSNSQVNCVFRDSRGFVWVGTAGEDLLLEYARHDHHARQLYRANHGRRRGTSVAEAGYELLCL